MYTNVVVLTYQSPEIDSYTYEVPKDLEKIIKPGQLVSVPFGKRNPAGIILEIGNWKLEIDKQIKPVTSILYTLPLLLPYQIELLKWMSFYYHAPMVNCLETMLPEIPKKITQLETESSPIKNMTKPAHTSVTKGSKSKVAGGGLSEASFQLQTNSQVSRAFFDGDNDALKMTQTLVLVPTINHIPETLAKYPTAKNYVIYHNELKTSEKFATCLKIISGHVDFIFGSRLAIFAPCPKLSKIIIYDEHDNAYKDEHSPYFDTLTVAEKISQLTKCKIQIFDSSPKITTYFNHQKDLLLGVRPLKGVGPRVHIVSMVDEKAAGNFSPISDILLTHLRQTQSKGDKTLLFLNKKTESGSIYCRICKYQGFAEKEPQNCPNCSSSDIWFNSLNINSLSSIVRKLIPGAQINLITQDYRLPQPKAGPPLAETTSAKGWSASGGNYRLSTIDIATSAAFYKLTTAKYDLVAHISPDRTINIPDFSSQELTFSQITDLKKLTEGLLVIQTYSPENPTIKNAAIGNYIQFFRSQIAERKALSYPPFVLLVKLTSKGKDEEKLQGKSQRLVDDLNELKNSLPTTHYPLPTILGPYKPFFQKKINKYNIILKMPIASFNLPNRERALKELSVYLKQIPKDWQITVEPASIN